MASRPQGRTRNITGTEEKTVTKRGGGIGGSPVSGRTAGKSRGSGITASAGGELKPKGERKAKKINKRK